MWSRLGCFLSEKPDEDGEDEVEAEVDGPAGLSESSFRLEEMVDAGEPCGLRQECGRKASQDIGCQPWMRARPIGKKKGRRQQESRRES